LLRFILVRIVYSLAVLCIISFLVFAATELLPGNVAAMILGTDATPQEIANLSRLLGLDRPPLLRFWEWVSNILVGDFGMSLRMQRPIAPILKDRLLNSLILTGGAFVCVTIGGLIFGTVTAIYHKRLLDRVLSVLAVIGTSMPEFVTGSLLILLFGGGVLKVLPTSGYDGFGNGVWDGVSHLVLPTLTLATILTAYVGRIMRTTMIEALSSDYVRTARLKGVPEWLVIVRHVFPNALGPTLTVLFMNIGWLFGGVVVVEQIFVFPGIGRLMLFGISERDWPVMQACALLIATGYVLGNLIGDVSNIALNPRLREAAT
jgi:peptide/nickel transport system permease protein